MIASQTLYVVRHAKAGDREAWTEDDRLRPLTKGGRRQAEGLVPLFRRLRVNRVVTSPYLRCSQTVRPLALDRGLAVEFSDALAEGAATTDALALLESSPDGSVLCTHGDVLVALIGRLTAEGMRLDGSARWKKGSTWVLERRLGRFTSGRYVAPPQFH